MSVPILLVTDSQRPVFLLNSRLGLFSATPRKFVSELLQTLPHSRPHFSRSYVCILPSSLTRFLSSALEFSSRLPVSVSGTVPDSLTLEILSRRHDCHSLRLPVGRLAFSAHLKAGICLRLSSACTLDRDYHRPAESCLTRHPFETVRGTGI